MRKSQLSSQPHPWPFGAVARQIRGLRAVSETTCTEGAIKEGEINIAPNIAPNSEDSGLHPTSHPVFTAEFDRQIWEPLWNRQIFCSERNSAREATGNRLLPTGTLEINHLKLLSRTGPTLMRNCWLWNQNWAREGRTAEMQEDEVQIKVGGRNRATKSQKASHILLNAPYNSRWRIPRKLIFLASEQCPLKVQENYFHLNRAIEKNQEEIQDKVVVRKQENKEQNDISWASLVSRWWRIRLLI